MIGLLWVSAALAGDLQIGVGARYSTMIDNLIGLGMVAERPTMRPAGGQVYVMDCATLCVGATAELLPVGGHASMASVWVGRVIGAGPVSVRPDVGVGAAYFGRKSLVPVMSGQNASPLIRVGVAAYPVLKSRLRPVLDVSWDTHPLLPAISLRRAHDLRIGLSLSFRVRPSSPDDSALGNGDGEGADS